MKMQSRKFKATTNTNHNLAIAQNLLNWLLKAQETGQVIVETKEWQKVLFGSLKTESFLSNYATRKN